MTSGRASDEAWMRRALELAERAADRDEVPVGAVLVGPDGLVAENHNRTRELRDPTAHAEILALREACALVGNYRVPGATVYATLEPCPMCAGALVHARVARIVYAASDPKSGACGTVMDIARDPRLNHSIAIEGGLLGDESAALLQQFFQGRR